MRWAVPGVAGALVFVAGCFPVAGPQVAPAQARGPVLVMVVTNDSGESRFVEYEHQAGSGGGGGGGEVGCGTVVMEFGEVTGSYRLMVDDDEVAAGRVPSGVAPTSYLVFEVAIAEDGSTTVAGPAVAQRAPQPGPMDGSCP